MRDVVMRFIALCSDLCSSVLMKWDPYSVDYGMGFYGHEIAAATYVVDHPTFGWLGFGGDVEAAKGRISVSPRDGARARLFIAPAGQWITLEAGKIAHAAYAPATGAIELTLDPADAHTPAARLDRTSTRLNSSH